MKKRFVRNWGWNPARNMTTEFGDRILGYPYDEELAGPNGSVFHVWLPAGMDEEERQAKLEEIWAELQRTRDALDLTWNELAEEIECRRWQPATIEGLRTLDGIGELRWPDGRKAPIDNFSRSGVVKVYDALNETNQAKLREILALGPGGLMKVVDICFSCINKARG